MSSDSDKVPGYDALWPILAEREFERHPCFDRRIEVCGYPGYVLRGPITQQDANWSAHGGIVVKVEAGPGKTYQARALTNFPSTEQDFIQRRDIEELRQIASIERQLQRLGLHA